MNNTVMKIHIQVFVYTYIYIPLKYIPQRTIQVISDKHLELFKKLPFPATAFYILILYSAMLKLFNILSTFKK